ncbi:MAG: phosphotransferase [Desulfarculales bacterium]|jgi:aminoglycoside/choline kinase family phosphotransferase|nr:phosphotransferase [Desulfarculales bacterium]
MTALLPEPLYAWLRGLKMAEAGDVVTPIAPDGSNRRFYRLSGAKRSLVIMYSPDNIPEAMAWFHLREHFSSLDLPVPGLLAARPEQGMFAMSDLGRQSLQEKTAALQGDEEKIFALYQKALILLARLQATGAERLNPAWCFDGFRLNPIYLMEREMGYFHRCLAASLDPPQELEREYAFIACRAGSAQPWGLIHRDFQSRNLVLNDNDEIGLVDFQGARLGPAQYDLASLLNDVYVNLSLSLRRRLLARYVEELARRRGFDEGLFYYDYKFTALSRILQNLGAFSYLSQELKKRHFIPYLRPALERLEELLAGPEMAGLTHLSGLLPGLFKKVRSYELGV